MSQNSFEKYFIYTKKEPSWIRYIKLRIEHNKNFLAIISGPTGSGKSYSSLSIAQMLDSRFTIKNVVFSGSELIKLINEGNLRKGSVIIMDEAGVDLSNRTWQSLTNRVINLLLQTFRHKNFILLFTAPYSDFIDSSTRKLFHSEFRTIGINYQNETVRLKPLNIQYNARYGKFYYKRLVKLNHGKKTRVDVWDVPKPSQEIITAYEERKNNFTTELNKSIEMELERAEAKKKPKPEIVPSNPLGLSIKQQELLKHMENGHSKKQLIDIMGFSQPNLDYMIRQIRTKGVSVQPILEKKSQDQSIKGYVVTYPTIIEA